MSKSRIAIIGAGLTGLTLAGQLGGDAEITVFEKSRGVGGRMATRRAETSNGIFEFDHGTQFITARTQEFKAYLQTLIERSEVAEWRGRVVTINRGEQPQERAWLEAHYVPTPSMNSLCKRLAESSQSKGCRIELNAEVAPLAPREASGWRLRDKSGRELGCFDWVISTAPPAQTSRLFANVASDKLASKPTRMLGCFTLMLGFASPLHLPWIAAKIRNSPVEWVAVNSSKPQRKTDRTSLVIHSNNAWAQDHIDDDQSAIEGELLRELSAFTGIDGAIAECRSLHRWRYALRSNEPADQPIQDEPYLDTELRLGSVGDWCSESRIESVWSGAMTYAARLQNSL